MKPKTLRLVLPLLLLAALIVAPHTALAASHNARLVHIGPSGLESYDAWTGKTKTLLRGMKGNTDAPYYSPSGASVASVVSGRSDRAGMQDLYVGCIASGTVFEVGDPANDLTVMTFDGWLDDYTAAFWVMGTWGNERFTIDTRTGEWNQLSEDVEVVAPSDRPNTAGDRKYLITVSHKQVMTVRLRKNKKRIARFKVPGSGNGKSVTAWSIADWSVSPDGAYLAYELWRSPYRDARVEWKTRVCTIKGKRVRSLKNSDGGMIWR